MTGIETILADAVARQRAGELAAAVALYDRVLAPVPAHVEALHHADAALIGLGRVA